MKRIFLLLVVGLSFSWTNDKCYVPTAEVAIKIAEAVWHPIYGDKIYKNKPFEATLIDSAIWHVYGHLPETSYEISSGGDTIAVYIHKGGVPHIYLNKLDGRILNVWHER